MRGRHSRLLMLALLAASGRAVAQSPAAPPAQSARAPQSAKVPQSPQEQLERLNTMLLAAEERLRRSEQDIVELKAQMEALRASLAPAASTPATAAVTPPAPASPAIEASTPSLQERVDVLEAEVKQQEQAKVGTLSRYPLHITGLLLFNASAQEGSVENINGPTLAFPVGAGTPSRRFLANFRQSILGVEVEGPHLWGASSFGDIHFDFSGSAPYSSYGTSSGTIRLRTGELGLQWTNDTVVAAFSGPLISPLTPTSYATVSEPGMSWSGNLWIWAPQLSWSHRTGPVAQRHLTLEAGLFDPPPAGTNNPSANRVASPAERSAQPAYEARIALERGEETADDRAQLGLGGYYSRQAYTNRNGDSWAVTADWKLPIRSRFEWSGEFYRGRSLAGLGGTVFKDVINGTSPIDGSSTFRLLNGAGGWTQAKVRFTNVLQTNAGFGVDNGFSRDFHSLNNVSATSIARDQMVVWNLIFTPKTYLILSPEYRFIHTSPIASPASSAHVFTFTAGFKF